VFHKTITIDVCQQDIDHGVRKSCSKCPVARAILRLYPELHVVRVDQGDISLLVEYFRCVFTACLPEDVRARIDLFDKLGLMEPFSFTLTQDEDYPYSS